MFIAGGPYLEFAGGLVPLTLAVRSAVPTGSYLGPLAVGALLGIAVVLGRVDPLGRVRMGRAERIFSAIALLVAAWMFAGILNATSSYEGRASVECPAYGTIESWPC
jgi:hypothetical protein